MIGQVFRIDLADDQRVVAKVAATGTAQLSLEGYMLSYLADHSDLPVPRVLYNDDSLLLMDFIEGSSHLGAAEQRHAAELLAALHNITQDQFGLERDTLIAALPQPNPLSDSWIDFFRQQRLLYMARLAHQDGPLPVTVLKRIEAFSQHLERWLIEPECPSLIHGDMWTGNILTHQGRIAAFIDPAIYYGHAEIELAFSTLFGTFNAPFFERYRQLRPIATGFFEQRRDIYNLYPLLVHVRLFSGGYADLVSRILDRFHF